MAARTTKIVQYSKSPKENQVVAVGLSLIIVAYRMYQNIDISDFRSLKG